MRSNYMPSEQCEGLEKLVDAHGLCAVMTVLADICHAKAEHLEANWQDRASAKLWTRAAKRIEALDKPLHDAIGEF